MKPGPKVTRCAIYTRKSTDHGLELEFNSLHAQRDACEAYIKSQASEGWIALPDAYDDGAYSGGNGGSADLMKLVATSGTLAFTNAFHLRRLKGFNISSSQPT